MNSLPRLFNKRRRRIVGLMSGTSADGVDAALVDVETHTRGAYAGKQEWELLHFLTVPYPEAVRNEILAVQGGADRALERTVRLHAALGHRFSDAVERVLEESGVPRTTVDAVASHGQTVCHLPTFPEPLEDAEAPYLRPDRGGTGWLTRATLQIGDPAVIAERTGFPVVSNFRARDVAAGGTGAPLVPLVDHRLFADPDRGRIVLNVGGIANLTAIPAGGGPEAVVALDTGPGNMVLDGVMAGLTGGEKRFDAGGGLARKGNPDEEIVAGLLAHPFFGQAPPRAAGREQFGRTFVEDLLGRCRAAKLSPASTAATATWLTAAAVHDAYRRFVEPGFLVAEVIVSGGGAHNATLLRYLSRLFGPAQVVPSDYYGLDVDAKEAVAFALLAHGSLEGEAGNLPGVTGASHPVVLGDLTPGEEPVSGS